MNSLCDTVLGDYLVIKKFSAGGTLLWQTQYRPASRLRGVWIAVDSAENPVVVASIIQGGSADPAGWVTVKLDAQGTVAWADSLPGGFADVRRVAIDAADNIYVAGRMWLTGNVTISLDSVLIKYSPAGARQWAASFDNGGAVDEPYTMAISPDGTRIGIAGKSGNMFMALMYDTAGNRLWARTDPNAYPANDLAFGAGNTSYFATGTYHPQDAATYQMAIARFDDAGDRTGRFGLRDGHGRPQPEQRNALVPEGRGRQVRRRRCAAMGGLGSVFGRQGHGAGCE